MLNKLTSDSAALYASLEYLDPGVAKLAVICDMIVRMLERITNWLDNRWTIGAVVIVYVLTYLFLPDDQKYACFLQCMKFFSAENLLFMLVIPGFAILELGVILWLIFRKENEYA